MSAPVVLSGGGEGEAARLEGEVLHLILARAFAPGAPVAFEATLAGGRVALTGKTIGSKRRDDGRFDVRLRMTNLRREDRARLLEIG
jgi:hypothetical protein